MRIFMASIRLLGSEVPLQSRLLLVGNFDQKLLGPRPSPTTRRTNERHVFPGSVPHGGVPLRAIVAVYAI